MDNCFRVRLLGSRTFCEEKMKIINLGVCNAILPVSNIVSKNGNTPVDRGKNLSAGMIASNIVSANDNILVYDKSGYVQLKYLSETGAGKIIKIAGQMITAIEELKDYTFFPDRIELNEDTIFISEETEKIKIALIPKTGKNSEKNDILYVFELLKAHTDFMGRAYMDSLKNFVARGNYSTRNMLAIIDEMRMEIGE